jgi:shikimate kinase
MKSVVLIGMSGVGKSFIGKKLAEQICCPLIDTDVNLEQKYGLRLSEVLAMLKEKNFLQAEKEAVMSALQSNDFVVVTPGGSIVYLPEVMKQITENAIIVYLKDDIQNILKRINPQNRGIVGLGKKTFSELYQERDLLYAKYAHHSVHVANKNPEEIVEEIIKLLA